MVVHVLFGFSLVVFRADSVVYSLTSSSLGLSLVWTDEGSEGPRAHIFMISLDYEIRVPFFF